MAHFKLMSKGYSIIVSLISKEKSKNQDNNSYKGDISK